MLANKLLYPIVALFSLAIFLFNIFEIAGSASGKLTNVYMGDASVAHINVTKILPSVAPIVDVFAKSLTASKYNQTILLEDMLALGESPALDAVLALMTNNNDMEKTLNALYTLAPLSTSSTGSQMSLEVAELIANAKNTTLLLDVLSSLTTSSSNSSSSTSAISSLGAVVDLLENSYNQTATIEYLGALATYSAMLPTTEVEALVSLLSSSSNITSTLYALDSLSTSATSSSNSSLSAATEAELFTALGALSVAGKVLASSSFVNSVINSFGSASSELAVLANMITSSTNTTAALADLYVILSATKIQTASNDTAALKASAMSLEILDALLTVSKNATVTLTALPELLSATASTNATAVLGSLEEVLTDFKNGTVALGLLGELETSISDVSASSSASVSAALPAYIELLEASTNVTATLTGLSDISALAKQNTSSLDSLVYILSAYKNSANVSNAYLYDNVLPAMFDEMRFATNFRLGIMSLCKYNSHGDLYSCTKAHAVQSFYMKEILYNELATSDFAPFVKALNITIDDVIIKGYLTQKQHLYVPGVKALLAFSIIAIILAFVVLIGSVVSMNKECAIYNKFNALVISPLLFINSLIASIILAVLCHMISHGVKHDKYNVTFKNGPAFAGLSWTGFVLSILIVIMSFTVYRNTKKPVTEDAEQGEAEESSEESAEDVEVSSELKEKSDEVVN